jgi:hypothetical protein
MFYLDPFFRDESGRFVPRPETMPAPTHGIAPMRKRPRELSAWWRVRCVRRDAGEWRVIFDEAKAQDSSPSSR